MGDAGPVNDGTAEGKVRFVLLQRDHECLLKMDHIRIFSRASPAHSIAEEINVKTCQSPANVSTVELVDSNRLDRKTRRSERTSRSLDEDGDDDEEELCARAELVAVSHAQLLASSAALQGETHNTQAAVKKSW